MSLRMNQIKAYPEHTQRITSVAFSPDGKTIVSGSWDRTIRLWDAHTNKLIHTLLVESTSYEYLGTVSSVAFSPDGKTIASGGGSDTILLWDVNTGKHILKLTRAGCSETVAFSPDGNTLISGGDEYQHTIRFWNIKLHSVRHLISCLQRISTTDNVEKV